MQSSYSVGHKQTDAEKKSGLTSVDLINDIWWPNSLWNSSNDRLKGAESLDGHGVKLLLFI